MRQLRPFALDRHPLVTQKEKIQPPFPTWKHSIVDRVACKRTYTIASLDLMAEPGKECQEMPFWM